MISLEPKEPTPIVLIRIQWLVNLPTEDISHPKRRCTAQTMWSIIFSRLRDLRTKKVIGTVQRFTGDLPITQFKIATREDTVMHLGTGEGCLVGLGGVTFSW